MNSDIEQPSKPPINWLAVVVLMALVLVLGVGIYIWAGYGKNIQKLAPPEDMRVNITEPQESNSVITPKQPTEQSSTKLSLPYKNNELGFSLQLPENWAGYETRWHYLTDGTITVSFMRQTNDPNWNKGGQFWATVLDIIAVPAKVAKTMAADKCKNNPELHWAQCLYTTETDGQNTIIGMNNTYTLAYSRIDKVTDYPADFGPELFNQTNDIIRTFSAFEPVAQQPNSERTYQNDLHGYTLFLPEQWATKNETETSITLNSPKNEQGLKDIEQGGLYGEGYTNTLKISYYESIDRYPDNDANHLLAESLDEYVKKSPCVSNPKKLSIPGSTGYKMGMCGFGSYTVALIEHNTHIYELFFGDEEGTTTVQKDAIINSIKFIK